jgi:hypothetical protein
MGEGQYLAGIEVVILSAAKDPCISFLSLSLLPLPTAKPRLYERSFFKNREAVRKI